MSGELKSGLIADCHTCTLASIIDYVNGQYRICIYRFMDRHSFVNCQNIILSSPFKQQNQFQNWCYLGRTGRTNIVLRLLPALILAFATRFTIMRTKRDLLTQ